MSTKVEIYLDKRKSSTDRIYSIRQRKNGKTRVLHKASFIALADVEFVVQPAGRAVTLDNLAQHKPISKVIHAFLRGTLLYRGRNAKALLQTSLQDPRLTLEHVGYAPQLTDTWRIIQSPSIFAEAQLSQCHTINTASRAFLYNQGIYALR